MRPKVISATIQEFEGTRYYLCGRYFQRKGVRLHRVVWEYSNGPIPDGFHVHHMDNDRANNAPNNLECIPLVEHLGERHGEESTARAMANLPKALLAAAKWHGSVEGKKWHSRHYAERIRPVMEKRVPATCHQCGGRYLVSAAKIKQGKFCGNNCKARALRKRRAIEREARRLLPDRS